MPRLTAFSAALVSHETTLPFDTVVARLEERVNKERSARIFSRLFSSQNQRELEKVVNDTTRGKDFLYFLDIPHGKLLVHLLGEPGQERISLYVIGNPLIAQALIERNPEAALNIPPRLLLLEKPNKSGTKIIYHLPSSIMNVSSTEMSQSDETLKAALKALDHKLEQLILSITQGSRSAKL